MGPCSKTLNTGFLPRSLFLSSQHRGRDRRRKRERSYSNTLHTKITWALQCRNNKLGQRVGRGKSYNLLNSRLINKGANTKNLAGLPTQRTGGKPKVGLTPSWALTPLLLLAEFKTHLNLIQTIPISTWMDTSCSHGTDSHGHISPGGSTTCDSPSDRSHLDWRWNAAEGGMESQEFKAAACRKPNL